MFRFSLQTVLDVRKKMEQLKYKGFSLILQEWQVLQEEEASKDYALNTSNAQTNRLKHESGSVIAFQLHEQFRQGLRLEKKYLQRQIAEKNALLAQKREELVEAKKASRTLEILKDKESLAYHKNLARKEQLASDEIASVFRWRNRTKERA